MKKLLLLLSAFSLSAFSLFAQSGPVTKNPNTHAINEDLVFGAGRTLNVSAGTLTLADGQIAWPKVNKTGSSLADLTTRSASDLTSGTLPDARFPATLPALSGANLTALNADNLASGTVADARLSANVSLLGSAIDLSGAEATGLLAAARFPALTGDVTTSAGAVATTLATVNSNVGTFGGATQSLTATVDAKGRVTALSAQTVTPAWASVTGKPTTLSGYGVTDAQPLDGDLTSIASLTTTAFGRGLLGETSAATLKSTLSIAQADVSGLTTSSSPTFAGANTGSLTLGTFATTLPATSAAFVGWAGDAAPLNPAGVNGSLLLASRNVPGAEVVAVTENAVRLRISSVGITASGKITTSHSTVGDNSAAFTNTSATGYGIYGQGGDATHYALLIRDRDANDLFTVKTGSTAISNALSVSGRTVITAPGTGVNALQISNADATGDGAYITAGATSSERYALWVDTAAKSGALVVKGDGNTALAGNLAVNGAFLDLNRAAEDPSIYFTRTGAGAQQKYITLAAGGTLTTDANLAVTGTGTNSISGVVTITPIAGEAYIRGPAAAGKYLTLQSGNATGGVNVRDSAGTEVAIYNQQFDKWTFQKTTTVLGTTTNDNAATGYVGEYVSSTVAQSGAVSLTNSVAANVTSISLTAGDWDIRGTVQYVKNAATTVSQYYCGISTTSATLPTQDSGDALVYSSTTAQDTSDVSFVVPTVRVSVASTTTVYLVARSTFAVNAQAAYGKIAARRVR